jgi:hypothetical protein
MVKRATPERRATQALEFKAILVSLGHLAQRVIPGRKEHKVIRVSPVRPPLRAILESPGQKVILAAKEIPEQEFRVTPEFKVLKGTPEKVSAQRVTQEIRVTQVSQGRRATPGVPLVIWMTFST